MPHLIPISAAKEGKKIAYELVLRSLHQFHEDQLEIRAGSILQDVMDESCIAGETKVVLLTCKLVEAPIV
jgi:hypothetical protein